MRGSYRNLYWQQVRQHGAYATVVFSYERDASTASFTGSLPQHAQGRLFARTLLGAPGTPDVHSHIEEIAHSLRFLSQSVLQKMV